MATGNKQLEQPAYNSYPNTWGIGPLNDNFGYIDLALGGSTSLNATGLGGTTVDLSATQCRPLTLVITGTPGGIVTYRVPAGIGGQWVVRNGTSGGYAVRIISAAGGTYSSVDASTNKLVSCDGTSTGMVDSVTVTGGGGGGGGSAGGSNTQVQYNNSGLLAGSSNLTFNGTTLTAQALSVNTTLGVTGATSVGPLTTTGTTFTLGGGSLNIGASALYISGTTQQVGIGTVSVGGDRLTVAGTVRVTSGGIYFPDGSLQATAATSSTPPGASSQQNGPGGDVLLSGGSSATATSISVTVSSGTQKWYVTAYSQLNVTSGSDAYIETLITSSTSGTLSVVNNRVYSGDNEVTTCAAIVDISSSTTFSLVGSNLSGGTTAYMRGGGTTRLLAIRLS